MTKMHLKIDLEFEDNRKYTAELSKEVMKIIFNAIQENYKNSIHIGIATDWNPDKVIENKRLL